MTKEMPQAMDYRELMKNQNNMGIDDDFGDMLVIPLPEVSPGIHVRYGPRMSQSTDVPVHGSPSPRTAQISVGHSFTAVSGNHGLDI